MTARERATLERPDTHNTLARLGHHAGEMPAPVGVPFRFAFLEPERIGSEAIAAIEQAERASPDRIPVVIVPNGERGDLVVTRLEDCVLYHAMRGRDVR